MCTLFPFCGHKLAFVRSKQLNCGNIMSGGIHFILIAYVFFVFFFFFKIWVVVWFQNVTTPGWGPSESTSRLRALVLTVRMISTVCFSTDFGTANESPGGGRELHVVNQAHFQFQKINKQLRIDFAQSHILLNAYWPITAQNRDLLFCIIVSWYNDTVSEWLATACVPGWNVWRILIEIKG